MRSEWTGRKLSDIAEFNPRESLPKGTVAKKIAMDKLQPFAVIFLHMRWKHIQEERNSAMGIPSWHV